MGQNREPRNKFKHTLLTNFWEGHQWGKDSISGTGKTGFSHVKLDSYLRQYIKIDSIDKRPKCEVWNLKTVRKFKESSLTLLMAVIFGFHTKNSNFKSKNK